MTQGVTGILDPAIGAALDKVLGDPDPEDAELFARLRILVENCLSDNYDVSEVKAAIALATDCADPAGEAV